ncbi:hypothetical protein QVD17_08816 [Tagetes erecta]|uniref:Uncharacterized protein n=1 Tax=Tagetes erecta TaxID=13708 RepID=A0AAD8KZF7_TARER|nr:hypothetical protein QVD17_08816 [Tagetes erecta]
MANNNNYNNISSSDYASKVPLLKTRADFKGWEIRFRNHLNTVDHNLWISNANGPHIPRSNLNPDKYKDDAYKTGMKAIPMEELEGDEFKEDLRKCAIDLKAYSFLTMAVPLAFLTRTKKYVTANSLYKMLQKICEGGTEIQIMKKQKLKRQLEMFSALPGESINSHLNRFVQLVIEMEAMEIPTNTEDINLRLLHSLPERWKHTFTTLKQTLSSDVQDLDFMVTKIESLAMDEQSGNLMTKKEMEQYVFKGEKPGQQAFISADVNYVDEHFQRDCFFANAADFCSLNDFCEENAEVAKGKVKTVNVNKAQDVVNIVLKTEEHKAAYVAFTATFQAYLGSHLTPMELMVQDLNDMHPDV